MTSRIGKSLTLKWMVFSVLLATIPLAIAGFSIIQIYQDNLKKSVITIEKEKANMVVERTRSFFEKITSNLRSLSIGEHLREGSSPGHIKSLLESFLNQNDYLSELTLLNEKGKELIKVSKYSVFKPSDLKDQSETELFRVASNLRTYYGGFKLLEGIVPTMVIAVPIEEYQKRPTDVLSAEIHLRYLWNLIPQIQIGEKGTTYVVDGEGDLIAHPDTRRVTSRINVKHLPMVDRAIAGKEGSLEFEDSGGEKYLVVYKPIKELGWGVIVQVPVEEAYEPIRQVARTALYWILVGLTVAVIFSLFLTRKLILPIKNLSKEMREVAKGNLDTYIQPSTKDELGILTESFNQMIQDLKQSHEALRKAEEKYRRIFQDSKDMVYITSVDGKVIEVNQAGVELFGYENKEEMKQVYVRDTFLSAEDRRRFRNEIRKEYFVKDFEVKLKRKDGTSIDVLITANARRDDSGNITSYEGIIKDITDRKRMEEELVQRTRELEALNEMGGLINQTLVDLDTIFRIALEKAMSLTGFEMGAIYLLNEVEETLELKFNKGYSLNFTENVKNIRFGEGVAGTAVKLKQPIVLSIDQYPSPRFLPFLREERIQALVGIPLLAKGKGIGAITLLSHSLRELSQREIDLLESIGNQIGLALENARLFEEIKKRLGELTILYEIMKISASTLNLDKMVKEIIDSLKSFFKFEALGILWVDENTKRLLPHPASYNGLSLRDTEKLELCVGKGITGWVAEKGEPLLVNDVRKDGRCICGDESISSEMCLPLKLGQKVIGVIDAQSRKLNAFTENDLRLFNIASRQIATIIENIRLQDEIKQSEEKYRTVVEGALDGVCVIGIDYQFKYVNEKLAEIQGYSREELIGTDFRNYLDGESKGLLADRENQRKRGIKLLPHFELNILRKDGEVRNAEISARSIQDSKGNVNIIVILKDITDRKQAEEAARRLAQENAIMAEIGRIISSTLNIEEVYEHFAEEVRKVLPFDRIVINTINIEKATVINVYMAGKGIVDRKVGEIYPLKGSGNAEMVRTKSILFVQTEDFNEYKDRFPMLLSTFQAGFRSIMNVPLFSKGRIIGGLLLRSLKPYAYTDKDVRLAERIGDQIAGAIANAQLFTERKQAEKALRESEEKYRTILENIEDGYYEVDIAGNFTFLNDSMCRIFGYPKEELMGMNDRQYTDKENAKRLFQAFNKVYRTGEPGKGFDYEIIRKDGTKRYVEASVSLQKDSSGKPIGFRGILRDITEKKRMEEQLFQSEKLRAVGEMASGVAHDFNNALAAILGNTQLLLYTAKDEDLKGSLKVIEKVARDSAQTVRRLQEFTRKRVRQELFKINVNDIIKDAIEITKPRWKDEAQAKGIHIDMVSNFDEISTVIGDASELREVITNMIFNAIEAMPEGGRIEIQAFQRKEKVYIQISDTGMGMAEEVRKKIFEPFFTTKPFSNGGLGLSMSYGIIKRFGGEIEVESIIGHGTIFTIILPVGLEGKEEVTISSVIKKGREARILVIDDEETVRSVLSRILSQVKHRVTVAENGEEGIRLFKEEGFDIVLTDLGMPGISGWEVGKTIKKMSPRTPVGMITGWGMEVDQATIKENGIDFVISKPFQFNQILKVIDETIASKGKLFMT